MKMRGNGGSPMKSHSRRRSLSFDSQIEKAEPFPDILESCIKIKIKLNFYFYTSLWSLKRF